MNRQRPLALDRRQFLRGVGMATVGSVAATSDAMFSQGSSGAAKYVLTNGRIWTGDVTYPYAKAIAIAGNRILAVGSEAAVHRHSTKDTRVVDLRGRFAMPGFNDSHVHMTRLAGEYHDVELLGAKTLAEVVDRIRRRVATSAPGEWIRTKSQWHEALLEESRMPTRADLDPVSPNNPVYIPRGGHIATANGKALELAGISRDSPNPAGGIIVRDSAGNPTGMLIEPPARDLVSRLIPPLQKDVYRAALKLQLEEFSKLGITSITNPRTTTPLDIDQLEQLHRQSPLNVRIHWTVDATSADQVHALRARYARGYGDQILRFSGIGEPNVDGGIEGAFLREPYSVVSGEQNDPGYRGIVLPWARDEAKAADFYLAAIEADYNVMTHVTGDGGLDVTLRILSAVHERKAFDHLRWTLHGCFLTDDKQLAQVKRLGLYITAQSQPYLLGAQMVKWWGRLRADRSIPIRTFLDAGIIVGGGSDAPAGIVNPMESFGWMVNRLCLGGYQLDKRWGITPEEALQIYTLGSAKTQFMDPVVGVLKPGMFADLAILTANPLMVAPGEISKIEVDATLTDGRVAYDRHGSFS